MYLKNVFGYFLCGKMASNIQFDEIKGSDDDRCVFRSKEINPRFFKLYFTETANNKTYSSYSAFHREYFVTKLLAQGMENVVKQDGGELDTPKALKDTLAQNNAACAAKINANTNFPHFITHHIGSKTMTLSAWLETQGKIPDAVIKTFAFQLIYLVGKMHSQFGVQHNDLYEPNVMVEPIESSNETVLDIVIGNDLFKVPLTVGHLRVYLFDFGASRLQKPPGSVETNNVWENVSDISFVANNPPEILYTKEYNRKGPEADMFMIGHVLLSMVANGNGDFKYREYVGVHTFDISKEKIKEQKLTGKIINILMPATGNVIYEKLGIAKEQPDVIKQFAELIWLNLIALDAMFRGYDKAKTPPADLTYTKASGVDKFYGEVESTYSGTFMTGYTYLRKEYVTTHFKWLKDACETHHPYVFSLLRRLMAFSQTERRGFALSDSSYCLTGALFHPYFQTFYKGTQSGAANLLFNPPLVYNSGATAITNATNFQQQEEIFYGDLLFKYLRDFSDSKVAMAIETYRKDLSNEMVLNEPSSNDIDFLLSKVYPSAKHKIKADKTALVKRLVGFLSKLPSAQQSLLQTKAAEAAAAQAAKAKANAEAQSAAEEARLAQEEADRKAQAKAKADADAAEAKRVKNAAEAKALADAKTAADAKANQDAAAQAAAEKKALEALEQTRLAAEAAAKAAAEATAKAADEAAAKAEAEKKQREAEEAARTATAAKAAEEEAKRQAEEAERLRLAEAKQKAEEEAARAKPAPIPPSGGTSTLTPNDLNIIKSMRDLVDNTNKKAYTAADKAPSTIVAKFTSAYDALANRNVPATLASVTGRNGQTSSNIKKEEAGETNYITSNIVAYASEVIAVYALIVRQDLTEEGAARFFSGHPGFKKIAEYVAWFNAKLGSFYTDIYSTSGGGSAAVAPATTPSEKEKESTSFEPTTPPAPKPRALIPAPKQVVTDSIEGLQRMRAATLALVELMEDLIDTGKTKPAPRSTPGESTATDHIRGIYTNLYLMAQAYEILEKKTDLADIVSVRLSNGTVVPRQVLLWKKKDQEYLSNPAIQNRPEFELLKQNAYEFEASSAHYTAPWAGNTLFAHVITRHMVLVGWKSITENKGEEWKKRISHFKDSVMLAKNKPPAVASVYAMLQEIKKTI